MRCAADDAGRTAAGVRACACDPCGWGAGVWFGEFGLRLGQADFAQHDRLIPTSFDRLGMRRRDPGAVWCVCGVEAAMQDKLRVLPWIPTFVGMSGERASVGVRTVCGDWTPAFAGDAAKGPLPVERPVGAA